MLVIRHADPPLVRCGQRTDDRRLDDRHQRHIRIRRHHDRAQIVGSQEIRHKDRRRAVRRADDADGRRVLDGKAQKGGQTEGKEDSELRRRTEEHELRIIQQRLKVDHGPDTDEQQQREQLVRDPRVEQHVQNADLLHTVDDLRHRAGHRQIDQDRTEAHRQQQRGLHIPLDRQIDEDPADQPHHRLLPGEIAYI